MIKPKEIGIAIIALTLYFLSFAVVDLLLFIIWGVIESLLYGEYHKSAVNDFIMMLASFWITDKVWHKLREKKDGD